MKTINEQPPTHPLLAPPSRPSNNLFRRCHAIPIGNSSLLKKIIFLLAYSCAAFYLSVVFLLSRLGVEEVNSSGNVSILPNGYPLKVIMKEKERKTATVPDATRWKDQSSKHINLREDNHEYHPRVPNYGQEVRILFTIKTTASNVNTRVRAQNETWIPIALEAGHKIVFISDVSKVTWASSIVASNCGSGHTLISLCCKLGFQIQAYCSDPSLSSHWWCAIDDDSYIKVKRLTALLQNFTRILVYIGADFQQPFAPGGAGYCLSPPAMEHLCRDERAQTPQNYTSFCLENRRWDDESFGLYLMPSLGINLTTIQGLTSHLDCNWLELLRRSEDLRSFEKWMDSWITMSAQRPEEMHSLHCYSEHPRPVTCYLPPVDYCNLSSYAHIAARDRKDCMHQGAMILRV